MANKTLGDAKKNKADEFYTQFYDIDAELRHYKEQFRGKIIFCNCDDPYESNFFKYFAMNFNHLELKKLIATCYIGSPIANTQLSLFADEPPEDKTTKAPHRIEINEVADYNGDGAVDLADVEWLLENKKNALTRLSGDGDFRSDECKELMKEADIVVTNPPFSLFREYVAQLMEFGKKFIIIGNKNAITYKEIFTFIQQGEMWLGYRDINADMWFIVPDDYPCEKVADGLRLKHIMGCWFTNLDTTKRHEILKLYKKYTPEEYPKYDNYDAIEVSKVIEIPTDYSNAMGVPITFLDKYNPEQFEILGITKTWFGGASKIYPEQIQISANGKKSVVTKLNDGATLEIESPPGDKTYYIVDDKYYIQLYARIIIRRIGDIQ
jgi:hypothetical protein